MEISFLNLRKNPGKVLEALKRRENITISRRGKSVAKILPFEEKPRCMVAEHPAFGLWSERSDMTDPAQSVRKMRKGRGLIKTLSATLAPCGYLLRTDAQHQ